MVSKAGAGPDPIPYVELTAQKLADAITYALKPDSQTRAKELATKISHENGNETGADYFHKMLPLQRMRCSIYPDKPAVWRVKRTQLLLSAKAAYVLYEHKVLEWDDLKLYRAQEYDADIGPTDPFSGGASAIIGTAGSIAMGFADMPLEGLKLISQPHHHNDTDKHRSDSDQTTKPARSKFGSFRRSSSRRKNRTSTDATEEPTSPLSLSTSSNTRTSPDMVASPMTMTPQTSNTLAPSTSQTESIKSDSTETQAGALSGTTLSPMITPLSPSDPESPAIGTERGRSARKSSSMADALHALQDPSSSPSRFRARSCSRSSSVSGVFSEHSKEKAKHIHEKASEKAHKISDFTAPKTLDTLYGTSKGIGRIIGTSIRSPMDFTMAITKGFHNVPRLYGEEPRTVDRVTDFQSGLRTAGKEFALGIADGISGIVRQPFEGAKKGGAAGFFKGVGRGIAGVVVKPSAAAYALPAYVMMGFYKELQKHLGESVTSYIIAARLAQGFSESIEADEKDRTLCVESWYEALQQVKKKHGFHQLGKGERAAHLKQIKLFVEQQKQKRQMTQNSVSSLSLSNDTSKITKPSPSPHGTTTTITHFTENAPSPVPLTEESDSSDRELEEVLRLSMRAHENTPDHIEKTGSHSEEDPGLWRAITNSLEEMRDADEKHDDELMLTKHTSRVHEIEKTHMKNMEEQEQLRKAIEESKRTHGAEHGEEHEAMEKALKESQAEADRKAKEDDIVMEYVKKQSLAEAEFRRRMTEEKVAEK
jgi:hypothetical protein